MFSFHCIILGLLAAICSLQSGVSASTDITCGGRFPQARDGFAKHPDGCSSWSDNPDQVRDTWGSANFRGVCDEHDRCYYTRDSDVDKCNQNFCDGLKNACRKAYCRKFLGETVCEPVTYGACLAIGETYCVVVKSVAKQVHDKAQSLQKEYETCIEEHGGVPPPVPPVLCSNGMSEGAYRKELVPGTRCVYTTYVCFNGNIHVGSYHEPHCTEL